jgi:hypothetical protein
MTVDVKAVARNLEHIGNQLRQLADEIVKCERGDFSPLMSDVTFEEVMSEALAAMGTDRADVCYGFSKPHRCSRCTSIVEAWMARKAKAA